MQATTHRYDPETSLGAVVTDEGLVIPFGATAMAHSGLRHLRVGQRVSILLDDAGQRVEALWIVGVGSVPARTPRP